VYYPTQASLIIDDKVVGKCARSVYFEKTNVEKEKYNARTIRTFELGNLFEAHEIRNYQNLGIYVDDHVKFSFPVNGISISGEADCIVILDGKYVGVEFKTSYGESFIRQHIRGYKRNPRKDPQIHLVNPLQSSPKIDHLLQVALYLYYFKLLLPTFSAVSIDEWRMVYFAVDYKVGAEYVVTLEENGGLHRLVVKKVYTFLRDGENTKVEDILIKDIYVEHIIERFLYIQKHIENKRIPPADYDYTSEKPDWRCNYCSYLWVCKNLEPTECSDDLVEIARPQIEVSKHADMLRGLCVHGNDDSANGKVAEA